MKILLTGGGSGGHFYPIVAIAEELRTLARDHKLANLELYFMSPNPYNEGILFNNKIIYKKTSAGKIRRYFSVLNVLDLFVTSWGVIKSLWDIFTLYPNVIFGKGGYASFPALFAARILRIPVVIHESDSVPGKTNLWAGKFAEKIAVSYPEAAKYFNAAKVAYTGQPVRKDLIMPLTTNAHKFLELDPAIPTILIIGGSLGARKINEAVMEALPRLVEHYQVLHQTGKNNLDEAKKIAEAVLYQSKFKDRYRPYDYMDTLTLRSAAGAASLVITRAGSSLFEVAAWEIPAIIIPITRSNGNHQVKNAFAFARGGAATVIEEGNLTGNILFSETSRILGSTEIQSSMKEGMKSFVRLDAAKVIAEELLRIGLRSETL